MGYPFRYILIVLFVSVSCELSLKTTKLNSHTELKLLPKLDNLSPEKESGVLHTLRKYVEWNFKEEKLVNRFTARVKHLQTQHAFMTRFLCKSKSRRFKPLQLVLNILLHIQKVFVRKSLSLFTELDLLGGHISKNKWIGSEDLLFSITGLHHLQGVYFIPASQISKGLNFDSKFGGFLNPIEMVLQAIFSFTKNRFVTAISWLQEAALLKKKQLSPDLLNLIFSIGIQTHNAKYLIRATTIEQYTNIRTDEIEDVYQVPILNGQLPSEQYSNRIIQFNKYRDFDVNARFTQLCSGYNLQSTKLLSTLHCYMDNWRHPYLYVNPMKVEQLSLNPLILQYYEIITNKTIDSVVSEVGPHVTTLKLYFDDDSFAYGSVPLSVSNSGNMGINFGNVSKATHKLTEILSGLTIWNGPNHNRYREHVYGRHLNQHNDGVDISHKLGQKYIYKIPNDEDIMGTMLFYLRVPRVGGCTAFVHAGVCSQEVPGSATFWYNMYKNGSYTTELRHGSCPVYHGDKIAITLFLKHNANWNKRLCSKDQFK